MTFGAIGKLEETGDKVRCHLCGKWFITLGTHLIRKHKLGCDEYREMFGLARSFSLCSRTYSAQLRDLHGVRIVAASLKGQAKIQALTKEERSRQGKTRRRQSTIDKMAQTHKEKGIGQHLQTPEIRAKALAAFKNTASTPEFRQKMSRIVRNWNQNPATAAVRKQKSENLKKSCNDPGYKEKLSDRVRQWHASRKAGEVSHG